MSFSDLPALNACLNGISAVFLVSGLVFIKKRRQVAHRNCMVGAFTASVLFLISYLTYHYAHPATRFEEPEWFRPIYLAILFSHVVLAVVILPMVLMTLHRAVKERFALHKKIARWTWPLWMYVSITGVVIYFLLYQIFPQN